MLKQLSNKNRKNLKLVLLKDIQLDMKTSIALGTGQMQI